MKKLSIEEKAKRYDDAIERAKEINNEQRAQPFNVMTKVFPELKESEDERIRKELIKETKGCEVRLFEAVTNDEFVSWLEKQGEKESAWSEEDEEILRTIISDGIRGAKFYMLQINWLKSLKERYTWKPSDEQIHAFEQVCDWYNDNFAPSETLTSLYNDLKKLKGE